MSGSATVTWANGGTTSFNFTETTTEPFFEIYSGQPIPRAYRPCNLGEPYIDAVVQLTGAVTGNTEVGANDPGVKGPVKALICEIQGAGTIAGLVFALGKHKTFHF